MEPEFKDGYYHVKHEGEDAIVEVYNGLWMFTGSEYAFERSELSDLEVIAKINLETKTFTDPNEE